ncbi:hypothetical protein BELL_0158g00040 [Botrytis elliptica]|uniref:Uncharacterized protein n=1 Tax=Botrytis elliptica TaxID=278938 RepID=A0A4Z1JSZ1_9HELO|nr:hypothetical protein EAE99_000448 [Botrytis elliptica]TGO76384.1 hypothetical protein BELL_0158g00040 [Botrytis elliptica]
MIVINPKRATLRLPACLPRFLQIFVQTATSNPFDGRLFMLRTAACAAVQETTPKEARPQESRVANERSDGRFLLGDLKRT